jgi:hypothetical protein
LVDSAVCGHYERIISERSGADLGGEKHAFWSVYALGNNSYWLAGVVIHEESWCFAFGWKRARQYPNGSSIRNRGVNVIRRRNS